jgi:uncharacterized membrane protein (DUF485 family)
MAALIDGPCPHDYPPHGSGAVQRGRLEVIDRQDALKRLAAAQWRLALGLTAAMMLVYFGFILLVAFDKPLLATLLRPGLSLGTLLGALVIVVAWLLIWVYVRWANSHYDETVAALRQPPR